MKARSTGSADDGSESSLESDIPNTHSTNRPSPILPNQRSSTPRSRVSNAINWKQSSAISNGNACSGLATGDAADIAKTVALPPQSSLATSDMLVKGSPVSAAASPRTFRSLWSMSLLSLLTASLGIALLLGILNSLVTRQLDPKGCRMSYMRPSYVRFSDFDTEHTRFATKYSLYLYREQSIDDEARLHGIPVLFIPGNAGSYKQVRPIAAEAANYFHQTLQYDAAALKAGVRTLDFFTVDFNEDITAFHGQTLLDQAEYLNEAVRYILALYSDPSRTSRDSQLPDPTSVIILGHSMGGVVARTMLVQHNYQHNSINTIITMSAPHARPPVTFDGQIVQIYDEINEYWRQAYAQKWANNNPLWHVTLVSIAGGNLDTIVPSDYASLESLVPETHGFTVFTTGVPTVWTSMDHQAILWCDQFRKVVAKTLYDIVDVHRGCQTKPRAERMRVFKKRLLTGLERTSEKTSPLQNATTVLTINEESTGIVHSGERLILPDPDVQRKAKAYLIAIPPHGTPGSKRFTFLTDQRLTETTDSNHIEVLLCSVFPLMVGQIISSFSGIIDLSDSNSRSTRLACKNAAQDAVLLPASTSSSQFPFTLEKDRETDTFSYLQYNIEHLSDHQFIVVVDRAISDNHSFAIAEFSDLVGYHQEHDVSLARLLTLGVSTTLSADRPMTVELKIPSLTSSLLAYNLDITSGACDNEKALFAPLVRQYLDRPFESRYFVNAEHVGVSLHGVAPYLPPPMQSNSRPDDGLTFQFWTDPTCDSALHISLKVDVLGSMGKLYMRYRTVFGAFPLLIVTLVLRKQFRVYDQTGVFVSFATSLDLSLRRSIPLTLLSLTLLSMSLSGVLSTGHDLLRISNSIQQFGNIDFHRNDFLIGTDDPFFWFLIPLIGVVCTGVCAMGHYLILALTQIFATLYALLSTPPLAGMGNDRRTRSPAFVPSTPRRRMITTAMLLFLVSVFIPYQFAYLVACLVQIFTVVRALRIHGGSVSSATDSNYYHYAHSVLLLMLWVLPINLPILAVWIRNLAVHWLTPFSSHHNVLSIMPFILLVENLTTGKMVPQLRNGLRHVTSILLFGTALCAGVYGVSHAYILHYLVNIIAAWLVAVHSTTDPWSLGGIGAMFDGDAGETGKMGKKP